MSGVNITILEGGKAENFGQVTKLRTSNGTDHDLWVPKTDVETKHLSVKKNGLYYTNQYEPTASEKKDGKFHDVYGWDTITVSVKKKVEGKKRKTSPSTGLDYDAPTSVDVDDDGNLIETELPVRIEIKQSPDKLQYRNGESISKNGMIVKAYYADGREWGTVPNNEIILDPSTASGGSEDEYTDGAGVNAILLDVFYYTPDLIKSGHVVMGGSYTTNNFIGVNGNDPVAWGWHDDYGTGGTVFATLYEGELYLKPIFIPIGLRGSRIYKYSESLEMRVLDASGAWAPVDGKFSKASFGEYMTAIPESTADPTEAGELQPIGGSQTITVGWTPPEGEEELTDTFDITVIPSN